MATEPAFHRRDPERGRRMADYWPLFALLAVSLLVACAASYEVMDRLGTGMHVFMGFLLCVFALLKLFTPATFAKGFRMVDLLGKRVRAYAFVYPYLELALGLMYFLGRRYEGLYVATIALFGFGMLGVALALRRKIDIACPCMGSVLNVPLSTVTLAEDGLMVTMAAAMLWMTGTPV